MKNLAWISIQAFMAKLPTVRGTVALTPVTCGLVSFWATTSSPARSAGMPVRQSIFRGSSLTSKVSSSISWKILLCLCLCSRARLQFSLPSVAFLPSLLYDGIGPGAPAWSCGCVCVLSGICGCRGRRTFEHPYSKHLLLFPSFCRSSTEFLNTLPHTPLHSTQL